MSSETFNLPDIPDLSGIEPEQPQAFENGWYAGTILEKREFTDKNGNDRIFESSDAPSARGDSRNIRLQVTLTRKSDGRTLSTSTLVNYKPEALSQQTVQEIAAHRAKVQEGAEWGDLFQPFMTLVRLGKLQKIAGVRQFQRNSDGGLELKPLYGKTAYFKIGEDKRNPQYKAVIDFQEAEPKRVPVL